MSYAEMSNEISLVNDPTVVNISITGGVDYFYIGSCERSNDELERILNNIIEPIESKSITGGGSMSYADYFIGAAEEYQEQKNQTIKNEVNSEKVSFNDIHNTLQNYFQKQFVKKEEKIDI